MTDGRNTAEVFLSNMDYAQVSAAVVTQEYIDGIQNYYLMDVQTRYPDRFLVCGLCEFRKPGFLAQAKELIGKGFKAIKIPANRLALSTGRVPLNGDEMMAMFHLMEEHRLILSIDMLEGDTQVEELRRRDYGMSGSEDCHRTFRDGNFSRLDGTNQIGTLSQRIYRVRWYHLAFQR